MSLRERLARLEARAEIADSRLPDTVDRFYWPGPDRQPAFGLVYNQGHSETPMADRVFNEAWLDADGNPVSAGEAVSDVMLQAHLAGHFPRETTHFMNESPRFRRRVLGFLQAAGRL